MSLVISEVDIEAYDNRGRAVLVAVVTGIHGTSEIWATQYRRNILSHGTVPWSRFFPIATPEGMYFWRDDETTPHDEPPLFTIDATRELKHF